MRNLLILLFLVCTTISGLSQKYQDYFQTITWQADTNHYQSGKHKILMDETEHFYFHYNDENEVVEFKLHPLQSTKRHSFKVQPSADYEQVDSLIIYNDYWYTRLRFHDLSETNFLKLTLTVEQDDSLDTKEYIQVPLQPVHATTISLKPSNNELYVGEEKQFEIITNNPENMAFSNEWTGNEDFEYRLSPSDGKIWLQIVPQKTGNLSFDLQLKTKHPTGIARHKPVYHTNKLSYTFDVKQSRLQFLELYEKDITYNEQNRTEGLEVELQNSRLLRMNKTYRIENQEKPGGTLIAELFTKNTLTNNKVLCIIRPFNLHKKSEGYLYIKDGDEPRFITNFDITPKTEIQEISILREGKKWVNSTTIYPGETIDLRIKGNGLHKADFHFEELNDITSDTLIRTENQIMFKLQVPYEVSKKEINIYNHGTLTDKKLTVNEYQLPRPFDFILFDYGALGRRVSDIRGPIIYDQTVKDIVFTFDRDIIDSREQLYGKQYLSFSIEITDKDNNLVELKNIEDIVICPSTSSVRSRYYERKDCFTEEISLNDYIRKKTYDLDEWSRVRITVSHQKDKHDGYGQSKEIELIMKRHTRFDVDVSFPAGLITIKKEDQFNDQGEKTGEEIGFGSLGGISMAMIAQFSFYHPDKIAKLRPYKIGAGFLAFNAFNFSDNNDDRDVGIVVLGSLYPTTRDAKLSFPLYVGGGYFLKDGKWFFLIGPGIRVSL